MDRNNRLLYPTYSPYQNIFAQSSQLSSVSKSTSKYVPYTSQIYISKNSQYSKGSISSCTVMSLEAAIQLQDRVAPSANLAETILNIGSEYKDDRHTGVGDILPRVTRYNKRLVLLDEQQVLVHHIGEMLKQMTKLVQQTGKSVSAILTKPPESILIHFDKSLTLFVLFDSHRRAEYNIDGAGFLVYDNQKDLQKYLETLFPVMEGLGNSLQEQMYNVLDASFLQKSLNAPSSRMMEQDFASLKKELQNLTKKEDNTKQYRNLNLQNKREEERKQKNSNEEASLRLARQLQQEEEEEQRAMIEMYQQKQQEQKQQEQKQQEQKQHGQQFQEQQRKQQEQQREQQQKQRVLREQQEEQRYKQLFQEQQRQQQLQKEEQERLSLQFAMEIERQDKELLEQHQRLLREQHDEEQVFQQQMQQQRLKQQEEEHRQRKHLRYQQEEEEEKQQYLKQQQQQQQMKKKQEEEEEDSRVAKIVALEGYVSNVENQYSRNEVDAIGIIRAVHEGLEKLYPDYKQNPKTQKLYRRIRSFMDRQKDFLDDVVEKLLEDIDTFIATRDQYQSQQTHAQQFLDKLERFQRTGALGKRIENTKNLLRRIVKPPTFEEIISDIEIIQANSLNGILDKKWIAFLKNDLKSHRFQNQQEFEEAKMYMETLKAIEQAAL